MLKRLFVKVYDNLESESHMMSLQHLFAIDNRRQVNNMTIDLD